MAQGQAHIFALEPDVIRLEAHIEFRCDPHEAVDVVIVDVLADADERHQAVQRTAVEIMEPQQIGDLVRDRALAGRGRTVDGDDRVRGKSSNVRHDDWRLIAFQAAIPPNAVKYSGNVLATQRGSLMRTGTGPKAASEKAIAMR